MFEASKQFETSFVAIKKRVSPFHVIFSPYYFYNHSYNVYTFHSKCLEVARPMVRNKFKHIKMFKFQMFVILGLVLTM